MEMRQGQDQEQQQQQHGVNTCFGCSVSDSGSHSSQSSIYTRTRVCISTYIAIVETSGSLLQPQHPISVDTGWRIPTECLSNTRAPISGAHLCRADTQIEIDRNSL